MTVGIDEVGRGCWAGPLVAAAVILDAPVKGLKDSKKLTKERREQLAQEIERTATAIGIGWVSASDVDKLGLTLAVGQAMRIALSQINTPYDEVIIDGHINFLADQPYTRALIKADDTEPAVSAASIIAKVARDSYMERIAKDYPDYGFEKHVGYGTALHIQKLRQLGVSDIHRLSYKPIKALLQ